METVKGGAIRQTEPRSGRRIAPPLTVSTDEIDKALEILDRALQDGLDQVSRSNDQEV